MFCRRGLVVSPSAFEKSHPEEARPTKPGAICKFDHHGLAVDVESRLLSQDSPEIPQLSAMVAQGTGRAFRAYSDFPPFLWIAVFAGHKSISAGWATSP